MSGTSPWEKSASVGIGDQRCLAKRSIQVSEVGIFGQVAHGSTFNKRIDLDDAADMQATRHPPDSWHTHRRSVLTYPWPISQGVRLGNAKLFGRTAGQIHLFQGDSFENLRPELSNDVIGN